MKRIGDLKSKIVDIDNVALAAHKAFRGKRGKKEVINFASDFNENIAILRRDMENGTLSIGEYNYFKIFDPKERVICAASLKERILHHSIMNVCHERFDKSLISQTYATRPGKGLYAALDDSKLAVKKFKYYAKLDVRKYFDSIDHEILKKQLRRMFKDEWLLGIFDRIIESYSVSPNKGVPIGNLTSQYFANNYLSGLDHFMKEVVKIKFYARYMDDVLICDNDKTVLKENVSVFQRYAADNLKLQLKPVQIGRTTCGVSFLGYRVMPGFLLLNGRSKRRFRKKLLLYSKQNCRNELSDEDYALRMLPLLAFTRHAKSRNFRKSCLALMDEYDE